MDEKTIGLLVSGSLFIAFVFFVNFMADRQQEAKNMGCRDSE